MRICLFPVSGYLRGREIGVEAIQARKCAAKWLLDVLLSLSCGRDLEKRFLLHQRFQAVNCCYLRKAIKQGEELSRLVFASQDLEFNVQEGRQSFVNIKTTTFGRAGVQCHR